MSQTSPKSNRSPASRKVGRHRVRKAIERMILDGRFRPGEKLVQAQLAKKFKVSQGLIREALFELKEHGLVETSDNRGMFVRSLDARSIYEMLVIREVFDGVVARECCGRMSASDITRLRKLADTIYQRAMDGRQQDKVALDRELHLKLAEMTDNRLVLMWAQQHYTFGKAFGMSRTVDPEGTRQGHHAILDAIAAGDREQAERVAREHVRAAWPHIEQALAAGPGMILWLPDDRPARKR